MWKFIFEFVWIATLLLTPVALGFGWVRTVRRLQQQSIFGWVAIISFLLATVSALLALATFICGQAIGGWPFYDHRLLRLYAWGAAISIVALILGVISCFKRNPLRWVAPLASLGMFLFWFGAAASE